MKPKETIPFSPDEIRGHIADHVDAENLIIGEAEQKLVDEIISTLPPKMNTQLLSRWCNNNVQALIEMHPELNEKANLIRNRVRNELVFKMSTHEFEQLKKTIEDEKPSKIDAKWIKERNPKLISQVRGIRTVGGQIDWKFIGCKLGIEDKLKVIEQQDWQLDEAINELVKRLGAANPKNLSPRYIYNNYPDLYYCFISNLRTAKNVVDWTPVVKKLDPEFQVMWLQKPVLGEVEPKKHYRDLEELDLVLKKHQNKLYLLVDPNANRNERDEILQDLVSLAKNGNDDAFDKVSEFAEYIVQNWIEKRQLPASVANHMMQVRERIKRSIYLYAGGVRGSYSLYLFVTVKLMSREFNGHEMQYDDKKAVKNGNGNHLMPEEIFFDEPTDEY